MISSSIKVKPKTGPHTPRIPCEAMLGYLLNAVTDVVVNISLSVNGVVVGVAVSVVFQEEVLEGHQVFLFERDHHLVAEPEGH